MLGHPHFTMRAGVLKNAATRHGSALSGAIAGIGRVGFDAALHDGAAARLERRALVGLGHGGTTAVAGAAAHRAGIALHDAWGGGGWLALQLALLVLLLLSLLGRAWR